MHRRVGVDLMNFTKLDITSVNSFNLKSTFSIYSFSSDRFKKIEKTRVEIKRNSGNRCCDVFNISKTHAFINQVCYFSDFTDSSPVFPNFLTRCKQHTFITQSIHATVKALYVFW